jgi:hypothetical protein
MIATVSLRFLYLIFRRILGLILLMGRTSSTKDVELVDGLKRFPDPGSNLLLRPPGVQAVGDRDPVVLREEPR